MNQPTVYNVRQDVEGWCVTPGDFEGDELVFLEEIATYIERDSEILLPIVPGETKHDYGLRMLKELAAEIRRFKR